MRHGTIIDYEIALKLDQWKVKKDSRLKYVKFEEKITLVDTHRSDGLRAFDEIELTDIFDNILGKVIEYDLYQVWTGEWVIHLRFHQGIWLRTIRTERKQDALGLMLVQLYEKGLVR